MGRPSRLELEVDVAGGAIGAVRVGGAAVPVIEGEIRLPAGSGEPEQGA
jgi:trans-2,3-dihydro-3-hydroxyanthranilate isomerase